MALVYQRTTLLYCSIKNLKPVIKTKTSKIIKVIGHWNSSHIKVSQGGTRGARTNFFQLYWQKIYKLISTIISIIVVNFVDFEASFVTLFKGKVIKNAPKPEIV